MTSQSKHCEWKTTLLIFRDNQQTKFTQKTKVYYARASSERHKIPTLLERIHTGGIEKVVVTQKVWLYYYYFTISCMFEFSFIYFDFHCFIIYYFLL